MSQTSDVAEKNPSNKKWMTKNLCYENSSMKIS